MAQRARAVEEEERSPSNLAHDAARGEVGCAARAEIAARPRGPRATFASLESKSLSSSLRGRGRREAGAQRRRAVFRRRPPRSATIRRLSPSTARGTPRHSRAAAHRRLQGREECLHEEGREAQGQSRAKRGEERRRGGRAEGDLVGAGQVDDCRRAQVSETTREARGREGRTHSSGRRWPARGRG